MRRRFLPALVLGFLVVFAATPGVLAGPPALVGGPCAYASFPGKADIIAVAQTPKPTGPKKTFSVTFTFTPQTPLSDEPLFRPEAVHTLTLTGGALPGEEFVRTHHLAPGRVLRSVLRIIRQGTCTPVLFDFPDIDLTNHGE